MFYKNLKKGIGFYLEVNGARVVMTNKNFSEVYKKFGFQLSTNFEYNKDKDKKYTPEMAFIKNDIKTYYKNNPVKVIIEER